MFLYCLHEYSCKKILIEIPDLNNYIEEECVDTAASSDEELPIEDSEVERVPWDSGRHIVELGVLANSLAACKNCSCPLQLSHTASIKNYGLAAILKMRFVQLHGFYKCTHVRII